MRCTTNWCFGALFAPQGWGSGCFRQPPRDQAPRRSTRRAPEGRCYAASPAKCRDFRCRTARASCAASMPIPVGRSPRRRLAMSNKVKFVITTTQNRFTNLQSGEVDLLSRSTTWTLGREGNLGLEFAWVNYYDGTGFLVKAPAGVKSAKEMDGATICVQPGTSTELAINDYFRLNNLKFTPILIQDLAEVQAAFLSGRCDAYSTDASALATFRFSQGPKAQDLVLLPDIISKEPLGVMVRKGDDKWFDLVRWTFIAMITAEEKGITSQNIDSFADRTDPDIRRLLGLEGDMGKALGIDNKWAYNVIKQVGNLGEVWDRNITPMGVQRGINNIWTKGGLQYAPPIR